MKVKALIFALMLIGIFICLPNQNQAYVGPPYFDPLEHPNEHPWQHDDSPGPGDSENYLTCDIVIFPINFGFKAIQFIQGTNGTKRSSDRPSEIERNDVPKLQFREKR